MSAAKCEPGEGCCYEHPIPLTRPRSASPSLGHPLPQGGEGKHACLTEERGPARHKTPMLIAGPHAQAADPSPFSA